MPTSSPIGVDYIFAPAAEEIYPKCFSTWVEVSGLTETLEGAARPGHFRGVSTVLTILFNLIHPKFVYGSEGRAADSGRQEARSGASYSGRNHCHADDPRYGRIGLFITQPVALPEQRRAAPVLYRALSRGQEAFAAGERNPGRLIKAMQKELYREPLARVDYVAITDAERLEPLEDLNERTARVTRSILGSTRLIDNLILNDEKYKSKTGRLKLG
jgi:pantoate--beta-alanine ligase